MKEKNYNHSIIQTYKYLQRDIPSVEYEVVTSNETQTKIIITDKTRNHRQVGYLKKNGSVTNAKNQLALDYITKFNTEINTLKCASPNKGKY